MCVCMLLLWQEVNEPFALFKKPFEMNYSKLKMKLILSNEHTHTMNYRLESVILCDCATEFGE